MAAIFSRPKYFSGIMHMARAMLCFIVVGTGRSYHYPPRLYFTAMRQSMPAKPSRIRARLKTIPLRNITMVSCQMGPTQIGPFWQDTLDNIIKQNKA